MNQAEDAMMKDHHKPLQEYIDNLDPYAQKYSMTPL